MKRLVIDTSAYAAFKRSVKPVVDALCFAESIIFSPIVIGELLAGFKRGSKESTNRNELERFLENPKVHEVALDSDTAEFYSEIFRNLKAKGRPVPTNDMWIAASAMQQGVAVCTLDHHFDAIDGLLVLNPD